jgi:hypothetical protein
LLDLTEWQKAILSNVVSVCLSWKRKIMNPVSATTSQGCAYHPDRPSAGSCSECQQPICLGCQMQIAGKTVCQQCVSAIRQRVAGEVAAGSAPVPASPPYAYAPAASAASAGTAYQDTAPAYRPAMEAMSARHVFGGLALGFLAGLAGLAAWIAFVYFTEWNLALIAIGIGWLIGIASVKGAGGRGGNVVAMISAILAFIFCGAGVLLFSMGSGAGGWLFGLVCLFFGVRRAYATPMAAGEHW